MLRALDPAVGTVRGRAGGGIRLRRGRLSRRRILTPSPVSARPGISLMGPGTSSGRQDGLSIDHVSGVSEEVGSWASRRGGGTDRANPATAPARRLTAGRL